MNDVPQAVLDGARRGDPAALERLWRHFQPHLLRYLRAKRVRAPEDVASEVWIDVARSIARFDGDGADFRRWLFTIGHRRSVDQVRRTIRRPETLVEAPGAETVSPSAADDHDDRSALDRAVAMLQDLSPGMAEAILLRVVHDMSVSEVAQVMARSEGSVRVLVHRGLRALSAREYLQEAVTDPVPPTMYPVS